MSIKILETLKILLGVSVAIAAVWHYTLPFEPGDVIRLIDIILAIIGTLIAGPAISRQTIGRFTGSYVHSKSDEKEYE